MKCKLASCLVNPVIEWSTKDRLWQLYAKGIKRVRASFFWDKFSVLNKIKVKAFKENHSSCHPSVPIGITRGQSVMAIGTGVQGDLLG